MSLGKIFNKLDDLLNPIVVKELRQSVQSRLVATVLILVLTVQTGFVAIYLMQQGMDEVGGGASFSDGRTVFSVVQGILLGGCLLLLPSYVGGRLAAERSDANVDLMFITTLRPHTIVSGKMLAAIVLVCILFSATAPFMMFSYLLRGVDVPTMLLILGIDFLCVIGGIQLALFVSAIPGARAMRGIMFLFAIGALIGLLVGVIELTNDLMDRGTVFGFAGPVAWVAIISGVVAFLLFIGFLYFWSVALLTAPTANRALPVRIYTFAVWAVMGAGCIGWAHYLTDFGPMIGWLWFTVILVGIQLLIAICERDKWGPRVARMIPRSFVLRRLAFLFYSGSAGGIGFAILLLGLTMGIGALHLDAFESTWRDHDDFAGVLGGEYWLTFAYVYCYAICALLLRTHFLKNRSFNTNGTWLLPIVLCLLGSLLPLLFAYAVVPDEVDGRYYRSSTRWWLWGCPPYAIEGATHRSRGYFDGEDFATNVYWFTSIWLIVMTALALPGVVKQFQRFRPSEDEESAPAEDVDDLPLAEPLDDADFDDVDHSEGIRARRRDE